MVCSEATRPSRVVLGKWTVGNLSGEIRHYPTTWGFRCSRESGLIAHGWAVLQVADCWPEAITSGSSSLFPSSQLLISVRIFHTRLLSKLSPIFRDVEEQHAERNWSPHLQIGRISIYYIWCTGQLRGVSEKTKLIRTLFLHIQKLHLYICVITRTQCQESAIKINNNWKKSNMSWGNNRVIKWVIQRSNTWKIQVSIFFCLCQNFTKLLQLRFYPNWWWAGCTLDVSVLGGTCEHLRVQKFLHF